VGTALFVTVSEAVRGFAHLGNLLFGAVLLLAVLALPRGVWGWVTGLGRRHRRVA
jgi:ABC-type branched-subunit amino acid transport system permease subunit